MSSSSRNCVDMQQPFVQFETVVDDVHLDSSCTEIEGDVQPANCLKLGGDADSTKAGDDQISFNHARHSDRKS